MLSSRHRTSGAWRPTASSPGRPRAPFAGRGRRRVGETHGVGVEESVDALYGRGIEELLAGFALPLVLPVPGLFGMSLVFFDELSTPINDDLSDELSTPLN